MVNKITADRLPSTWSLLMPLNCAKHPDFLSISGIYNSAGRFQASGAAKAGRAKYQNISTILPLFISGCLFLFPVQLYDNVALLPFLLFQALTSFRSR